MYWAWQVYAIATGVICVVTDKPVFAALVVISQIRAFHWFDKQ